jgi:hypothetical protein
MRGIFLVMGFISPRFDHNLAVFGMGRSIFDCNHDSFIHLVADDYAHSFFDRHWRMLLVLLITLIDRFSLKLTLALKGFELCELMARMLILMRRNGLARCSLKAQIKELTLEGLNFGFHRLSTQGSQLTHLGE